MSTFENLYWTPEDEDEEPYAAIQVADGSEYMATRVSTRLVQHMGALGVYDFIYCKDDPDDFVIFKSITAGFDDLADYMIANGYPHNNHEVEVLASLVKAYSDAMDRFAANQAEDVDFIPSEWETE